MYRLKIWKCITLMLCVIWLTIEQVYNYVTGKIYGFPSRDVTFYSVPVYFVTTSWDGCTSPKHCTGRLCMTFPQTVFTWKQVNRNTKYVFFIIISIMVILMKSILVNYLDMHIQFLDLEELHHVCVYNFIDGHVDEWSATNQVTWKLEVDS